MKKVFLILGVFISLLFSVHSFAQQSQGGDDLAGVCRLSGGTWTGSEGGNWACCWADWGCYGCYNSVCKMQCRTERCRKANGMSRVGTGQKKIEGLAPKGMKAPIIPKNAKPGKVPAKFQMNKNS